MKEYEMHSNINVLTGEDKHRSAFSDTVLLAPALLTGPAETRRWFKRVMYQTNHINVERLLLEHERLRQSIRLILIDTLKADEPQITAVVISLHRNCPTLFDTLLSRSDQQSLRSSLIEYDEEDDEIVLQSDEMHKHVIATGRLSTKYCQEILQVLVRASDSLMTTLFKSQLESAFAKDCTILNVMYFGAYGFQSCKRIGFTSR